MALQEVPIFVLLDYSALFRGAFHEPIKKLDVCLSFCF